VVDIYLIRYNNPHVEDIAIKRIEKYTNVPYKLHVYDNYKKKEGVSTLWNRWLRGAKNPVVFINSDAYVTRGWLKEMLKYLTEDVVVVGPSGNVCGTEQGKIQTKKDALKSQFDTEVMSYVSGYCMLIRDVGIYFPRSLPFYHNDIAWQALTEIEGYKSIWAKRAFVKHLGASTVKKEGTSKRLEAQSEVAYKKFMKGLDNVRTKSSNR
jgi:GT2 family glycosyltransferase